jgi:phosphatidate cytidylyltransferase
MRQRIVTGVLAALFFLTILELGNPWYALMISILSLIAYHEFVRLNSARDLEPSSIIGYAGIIYIVFPWNIFTSLQLPPQQSVLWLLMFLYFALTVISKNRTSIDQIALSFIGVVYIGLGFHYMAFTRTIDEGLFWTLLLFGCIWFTDIGGYFAGRIFGKRLLWPLISPKKTIEGAIGGIALSIVNAVIFSLIRPDLLFILEAVMIGLLVSILGQLGDLIQSAYKRIRNIKDSGKFLPGHGGILDRTDSWIIVFPFVHLLGLIPQ